jgi:tetratricopeptide (TPR) repeat protein
VEPLLLAKKIDYKRGIALLLSRQAGAYGAIGDNAKALKLYLEAIRISEKVNDLENLHRANNGIGNTYSNEDPRKALNYHWKAPFFQFDNLPGCQDYFK